MTQVVYNLQDSGSINVHESRGLGPSHQTVPQCSAVTWLESRADLGKCPWQQSRGSRQEPRRGLSRCTVSPPAWSALP